MHHRFLRRSKYDKCLGSNAAPSYSYSLPFNIILQYLSISYRSNVVKSGIVKNVQIAAAKEVYPLMRNKASSVLAKVNRIEAISAPSLPAEADIPWHTVLILSYSDHRSVLEDNFNERDTPENIRILLTRWETLRLESRKLYNSDHIAQKSCYPSKKSQVSPKKDEHSKSHKARIMSR